MAGRHIYVIQMHTKTIPSKFVRFITRYKYSHVVISLDKDCKTTYGFGRKTTHNILNGGFAEHQKSGEFFKKFSETSCRIYELGVTDEQYNKVKEFLEQKKKQSYLYKYDFLGIVLHFFKIPVSFKYRAVCSQFVAEVLKAGDILYFEKPTYMVKPKDFEGLKNLRIIYEGKYSDYH